jgi:hypothetical protein
MRCWVDISASRPDPALRVLGSAPISWDEASYALAHQTRLHFQSPLSLDIYVEARDGEEILVVATGAESRHAEWTAPPPYWVDE